jgi:hypothetical protein
MSKTIHIFDLDDSLTVTPVFADFIGVKDGEQVSPDSNYPEYFKMARAAFWDRLSKPVSFVRKGDFIIVINKSTGKPFDGDAMNYFRDRMGQKMVEVFNDILILRSFTGFHSDPRTIGKRVNEPVYEAYKSATNRMILTGRDEKLRPEIEKTLSEIGVEYPNYGLLMYSGNEGIKKFKTRVIAESIRKNGWEEVHFYEDRQDWLHFAEGSIKEKFPDVKFVAHHISNVKNEMKF